ncbi:hypothetical protein GO308_12745 [Sphingomonas sp. SFZ2018-12]|uniref:GP88 family protein n=1 Tax=Sphingomonas sp. SFZ2018-12 TaxID=2683197 RepID=UPI001F0F3B97|nr:hypothetical protein [Sphingomonas sp. SFZ2018-12]MCH4893983.1 hypothetical protein [Sphingomonas sp. SFZ2018-12]
MASSADENVRSKRIYKPRSIPSGGSQHRIPKISGRGRGVVLHPAHPAVAEGRTLFPSTVVPAGRSPRLLISGVNQRKIGKRFTRGAWKGMPIYTLTLEERATCPRSCDQWASCYGNNMPFARRHIAGAAFERKLWDELVTMNARHPRGFVVRLHILGDFYSEPYVDLWHRAFAELPALRVFGYTARDPETAIGLAVIDLNLERPDRCRIRFSGSDAGGFGALVIEGPEDSAHVICPAQTDATDCCATCAICTSMQRVVEFLRH